MKVAVYEAPNQPFAIEDRPIPEPADDEVLVRIGRCGICATDVSTYTGAAGMEVGVVYGHEFAGEIVARGSAVRELELGQLVTAQSVTACGKCAECQAGHLVFCPEWRIHPTGGFGQFMTLPEREVYVLPPPLTLEDGALVEPLAVGLRGIRLAGMTSESKVLVLGAGPIGLCAAFWASQLGAAKLTVAATSERRRAVALKMGASDFVVIGDDAEAALYASLGGPPDIVMECAGFPGAMMQSMQWVRPKGVVVALGYGLKPEEITTAIPLFKEIRVQFSMTYDHQDYRHVIATLAAGNLQPRCMITDTVSLDGLNAAITGLLAQAPQCKVMVDPWR